MTDRLARALADNVADPAVRKRFEELGATPVKMPSQELTNFIARQVRDRTPAIKATDLKP